MQHTIDKKDTQARITVTIPWDDIAQDVEARVAEAAKHVDVKGFRKGAVPQEIAAARVDRAAALADAADAQLRTHYATIVREEKLRAVGAPRVSVTKLAEGNDVEVMIDVALLPTITLPRSWRSAIKKVNKEAHGHHHDVSDDDVTAELERTAASRATLTPVDRAARSGDHVKVDFQVLQDGVAIENGTSTDHSMVLGTGVFIPGFEEQIIGMTAGEQKTFELTFPTEYHATHLAGRPATFAVTLKAVEERAIPTMDDAFAQSLGEKFSTLAQLRTSMKDGMEREAREKHQEEVRAKYLDALADLVTVTLPEDIVAQERERMLAEFAQQVQMMGMTMDAYLEKLGKTRDELSASWAPQARKRVLSALVLEQLAEDENITVDHADIEQEMNKMLSVYKDVDDAQKHVDMPQLYEYATGMIRNNKVFAILEKMT